VFILPLNDDRYVGRAPYVIIGLTIVNGLVLAATYLLASSQLVFSRYGFVPAQPHILTIFSSLFLHAGIFHYLGNMFFLWMFGYRIENTFGRWLFVLAFLLCGCGATGLHYLFNQRSTMPYVGASGAISGIMGCYFVLFPKSRFNIEVFFWRFHVTTIPTDTRGAVGAWVAEQTLLGLLTQNVHFSSTAFWAHIGGFLTGVGTTLVVLSISPGIRTRGEQPFIVRYLKGAVHDMDGNALAGARFEMLPGSGESLITTTTDSKGRFEVGRVPDGSYSFTVSKEGWHAVHGNIVMRKKTRHNIPVKIRMAQHLSENVLTPGQAEMQRG
jgi:membrane associated rhomboid family serine protease